ncbi:hypothetical protein BDV28DRAFT_139928 [Aspergillus coremiiformis]|uniref:Galactose oxidase n=1 Tax=Aspergillus coremiiformis TaxID=138285 RepID=A0A5N6YX94_9EURO|nr:hypothetical protein BDV28DRAFT_139928 [Aspergillus coremiiformis]
MDDRLSRTNRRRRTVGANWALATLFPVLLLAGPVFAATPYTPFHLLYSTQHNGSIAYLLRSSGNKTTEFLSLNISQDVDSAKPQYTTLLDNAPFQLVQQQAALVPAIDQHGILKVYAGDCHNTSGYGALWQFTPDAASSIGNGTWEKIELNGTGQSKLNPHGPNYLAAGFTYASTNTSSSSFYAFGGMCPLASASEATWIAAADYSHSMIVLEPPKPSSLTSYRVSATGDRAPPIPEAGFTITPLHETYRSTSGGTLLQQQDFLMIGGQTQDAFINMSQVAVFSLPQSSWSFATIESTQSLSRTELAIRESPVVEPRSGHTAVLSPDGGKVVVFGGWVGSTNTPANPQLAILEIGSGYTDSAEWAWKIPPVKDTGIAEGTGLYGHGATMLPGGIMMITGGYRIAQSPKRSDEAGPQLNSQVLMYNVTSGKWVSSYTNPYKNSHGQGSGAPSKPEGESKSSASRRAGLGAGLGLGIPIIAAIAVFLWFYFRRRRVRRARDQELRKLALSAERSHFWGGEESHLASSIRRPSTREMDVNSDYPWSNNRGFGRPTNWRDNPEIMAERTGLLTDIPSPTKSSRPPLNAKVYRPPAQCNEYRRSDGTSDIHPIDEREEDEAHGAGGAEMQKRPEPSRELALLTPQSTIGGELFPEGTAAFVASIGHDKDGRAPDNEDRTSSNLSDSSRSINSAQQSRGLVDNQPGSGCDSPEKPGLASTQSRSTWSRPNAVISQEKRYSSDSFSTAHTTLSQRQAEGERLLPNDSEPSSSMDLVPRPLSISKPRASEWIGNVRRVLSVTRKRPQSAEDGSIASSASGIDRRSTVLGSAGPLFDYETESKLPRRSVSASAELFRRKQGAKDWGAGNLVSRELIGRPMRDDFGLDGLLDPEYDDWDVEGAAENRRVQVTFTVPKEKLRVVNATANDMDTISENSISRSNSRT